MKLSQYWRDVLTLASASDETYRSILNRLKTLNQAVGNAGQQRVAVVEARRYTRVDYCLPCFYRQHSNDRAELAELGWSTHSTDLCRHSHPTQLRTQRPAVFSFATFVSVLIRIFVAAWGLWGAIGYVVVLSSACLYSQLVRLHVTYGLRRSRRSIAKSAAVFGAMKRTHTL